MYKIYSVNEGRLTPLFRFDAHKEAAEALSTVCPKTLSRIDCFKALDISREARGLGIQVTLMQVSLTGKVYCIGTDITVGDKSEEEGRAAA